MPKTSSARRKRVPAQPIGWREIVRLPDLGGAVVKAKADTGARTSSLHAFALEEFERDGQIMVRFEVHPEQRTSRNPIFVETEVREYLAVRSSNGQVERRPVIRTPIEMFDQRFLLDLTLTNRDAMGFRLLLGRRALKGRFLVDPGRSFLGTPRSAKARAKALASKKASASRKASAVSSAEPTEKRRPKKLR